MKNDSKHFFALRSQASTHKLYVAEAIYHLGNFTLSGTKTDGFRRSKDEESISRRISGACVWACLNVQFGERGHVKAEHSVKHINKDQ